MENSARKITCPHCGHDLVVSDILYQQVSTEVKKYYIGQISKVRDKLQAQSALLRRQREQLAEEKKKQKQIVSDAISYGLERRTAELREKIEKEIDDEKGAEKA